MINNKGGFTKYWCIKFISFKFFINIFYLYILGLIFVTENMSKLFIHPVFN